MDSKTWKPLGLFPNPPTLAGWLMIRIPDTVFIGAEGGAALHQGIGGDLKLFLIG